jgi:hypothetical protein
MVHIYAEQQAQSARQKHAHSYLLNADLLFPMAVPEQKIAILTAQALKLAAVAPMELAKTKQPPQLAHVPQAAVAVPQRNLLNAPTELRKK